MTRVVRLVLDLNVFVSELLARRKGVPNTAAETLVGYAAGGRCPAGPVQLIISVPMLENLQNVLHRKFGYSLEDAHARTEVIQAYSLEGPLGVPPTVPVAMGFVPIETEEQMKASREAFERTAERSGALFHGTQDDRYVLETALASHADMLVTANLKDFGRGSVLEVGVENAFLFRLADRELVVCAPSVARAWLENARVPTPQALREFTEGARDRDEFGLK